jgi:NADH:ubiquinone oxidoreductase subunit
LTKFNADKPKEFSKNKIIRVLDEIATNTQQVFETSFLGRVGNDDAGRNLFKANRVAYLQDLQNRSIIQNFAPADLEVLPGEDSDAVVMNLNVQPVDAMEKLYVTITVS